MTRRVGLDVGGTNVKLVVLDGDEVVDRATEPTHSERGPEAVLDRIDVRGRVDPNNRRIEISRADLGGTGAGGSLSGVLDFSGTEARLIFNLSANPMTASVMRIGNVRNSSIVPLLRSSAHSLIDNAGIRTMYSQG